MKNTENRKLVKGYCSKCGKTIYKRALHYSLTKQNFCSIECQKLYYQTGEKIPCSNCGKEVYRKLSSIKRSKSGNVFCNKTCATKFHNRTIRVGEKHPNFTTGFASYRVRAFKEHGKKCNRCGYSKYIEVLEIHHKDYNRINNHIDNLEVLCSNCHREEHI